MSAPAESDRLVRFGRWLIRWRSTVLVSVLAVTAFFAYHTAGLRMMSRFDEILPTDHPFVQTHTKYAKTFGGANTILILIESKSGTIFDLPTLNKIFNMTQVLDTIYGVNHYQIESIAHRTNRTLRIGAGGLMEMQPVMDRGPKTDEDVRRVRRIVHTSQNLYGVLVSLDDRAALIRASFIEGRLDHRRLFNDIRTKVVRAFEDDTHDIVIAGEPELYGWVYYYASQAYWILAATLAVAWILLYVYFRDWRGALRPTLSGTVAAIWGLGFIKLIGFTLDPLTLVIPFFITARAVSHSAQMHDRYYEEYRDSNWNQEDAIVRSFAALFVPTLSGIITDALGVLAILLVPIVLLQKLAISASFWIAAIVVSELLLNPVIYSLLAPPDREIVEARPRGIFQRIVDAIAPAIVSRTGRTVVFAAWAAVFLVSVVLWTQVKVGDSEAVTPLLPHGSKYNEAHRRIQDTFGGVEPLIVVVEASTPGAVRIPQNVKTISEFQRFMEKDPGVGASFSFADVIVTMAMAIHEYEPKWAVIPTSPGMVSMLFGAYFMGTSYQETARFMDADFTKTAVFFYCKDHRGDTIRQAIAHAKEFVAGHPLEKAQFRLAGGLIGVLAAANEELVKNDVLLNALGYITILLIVAITYRSIVGAILMVAPLVIANATVNAYMGARGIGINVHTLPVVTVGIGFGIDFAFYVVSRAQEELARAGSIDKAVLEALRTAGKTVTFTAITMVAGILFWGFSEIRFNAEMGFLLAIWMVVSFLASVTLLPALLVALRPRFLAAGAGVPPG
ncbi:MAG: uncharacterized protein QOD06_73 [Candidatus Binatota bacterium]|jgi:predicted RND superfamily exporter protein|nr:uncharacterized protein [Candidatus Binatota bacterium]